MNCANHPEAPAIAYCRECGKPLCEACRHAADGTVYCEQHAPVSAWAAAPPPQPAAAPVTSGPATYGAPPDPSPYTAPPPPPHPLSSDAGTSPGLAFMLGFSPGVGAIYNGQYVKGLIHVIIMGLLIAIVSSDQASGNLEPLFGMMIAVWV